MLATKQKFTKLRELKSYQESFPTNGMKLEINYKKTGKFTGNGGLDHMLLNIHWVKEETKRGQKRPGDDQ